MVSLENSCVLSELGLIVRVDLRSLWASDQPNGFRSFTRYSFDQVWDAAGGGELTFLRSDEQSISDMSYSPDGLRIVSGSEDGTVRVLDAASGASLAVLSGHKSGFTYVSYSPDGTRIVSGSCDNTVRVWDAESGAGLSVLHGHEGFVGSVSYSPDGTRIVSGSEDGTVRVWDAASGALLAVFRGHQRELDSVSYSPDRTRIVTSLPRTVLDGYSCVSYSPDGTRIITGLRDATVRVWNGASGAELAILRGHTINCYNVHYSPDGTRIVSGSYDKTVRVWDAATGKCLQIIRGEGDVAAIAAGAQDFRWRALARDMQTVVEEAATGRPVAWLPEELRQITTHPGSWAAAKPCRPGNRRDARRDDPLRLEVSAPGSANPVVIEADASGSSLRHGARRVSAGVPRSTLATGSIQNCNCDAPSI